jgi:hypothetical protein
MRHEIHRLQTITDAKGRHAGCLQCAATGFIAYDRSSNSVGCFPTAERAARKLMSLAARQST